MLARQIAGRYELGERLGVGGMSTVQEAFDRRLERHVAVKLLAEHLAEDPQFVSRFRREALSAARLVHPNIVQVFDFGLDDTSGRHYIVMEVVRGQSGAEILRERGRLGVTEAVDLVAQACRGLDYAHRNGVVHRDVKPGNLIRSNDGVVKLADFGIAKATSEDSSITQIGSVLGTASYLAPEQARGEEAGPAADLYALGVVTYQLLSGRLPYEAVSLTELALKQQREAPAYLHELDPAIPAALGHAVDRALSLDPLLRHASAEAMRTALLAGEQGIEDEGTRATQAQTAATTATPAAPTAETTWAASEPATQRTSEQPAIVTPRVPRPAPADRPGAPADPFGRPGTADPGALASMGHRGAPVSASRAEPPVRRRGSGLGRLLLGLLIVALLLGGGAAAVIATSGGEREAKLRRVTADKVEGMVDELTRLIEDNTR